MRDTGPGISAADQAKLFQEFQQADNAITRKKGGTGLGLAISKRIIEMHGGKIWLESQVGQGSTFSFTVPVRVDSRWNGMSKRILVVEDQEDNRQIIRDMLTFTDYEITEAESGEQALTAIAAQRPDLILMDIQMPVMDGYEVTRGSRPIRHCVRSRSSRSPPIRSVGKNKRRGRLAVTDMCLSPTARANCWRKFISTCPRLASCDSKRSAMYSGGGALRTVTAITDCRSAKMSLMAEADAAAYECRGSFWSEAATAVATSHGSY